MEELRSDVKANTSRICLPIWLLAGAWRLLPMREVIPAATSGRWIKRSYINGVTFGPLPRNGYMKRDAEGGGNNSSP